jgi:glycine cleavage system H protein
MEFPKDLRFTEDHEWARKNNGTVTIGITAFAVEQLGDITLVDLPNKGDEFSAGEAFGTVESVKSVSDLYAPISGKVSRINQKLEENPELVNESPYDEGWLIEMEPTGKEFEALLGSEAYAKLVEQAK